MSGCCAEEKRKKDFANLLKVKLNSRVKFQEIDGLLCCWVEIIIKLR